MIDIFNSFSEIIGNAGIIPLLRNESRNRTLNQKILIVGEVGTGKSEIAKLIARTLLCSNINDSFSKNEININNDGFCGQCATCKRTLQIKGTITASTEMVVYNMPRICHDKKVDEVLDRIFKFKSLSETNMIFILEEVHALTEDQQDLFYCYMDEMQRGTYIVMTTSEPKKLKKAFSSRVMSYRMSKLDIKETARLFNNIYESLLLTEQILHGIFRRTEGIPREIIKLASLFSRNNLTQEEVESFLQITPNEQFIELISCSENFKIYHDKMKELVNTSTVRELVVDLQSFFFDLICMKNKVETTIEERLLEVLPKNITEEILLKYGTKLGTVNTVEELTLILLAFRRSIVSPMAISEQVISNTNILAQEEMLKQDTKEKKVSYKNQYGFKVNKIGD